MTDQLDAGVAHSARLWNYLLGGTDNFAAGIAAFLESLDALEPGVVTCSAWRPDPAHPGITDKVSEFAAVARKP